MKSRRFGVFLPMKKSRECLNSRRAIAGVPEHYEAIERQDERDRTGDRFFTAFFIRLRSRNFFVSALTFG